MSFQEWIGGGFVVVGSLLFLVQIVMTLATAISATNVNASDGFFEKVFKALLEKFPVAAIGVAAVWLGSNILGWWASGS